jgi:hypothetical protein
LPDRRGGCSLSQTAKHSILPTGGTRTPGSPSENTCPSARHRLPTCRGMWHVQRHLEWRFVRAVSSRVRAKQLLEQWFIAQVGLQKRFRMTRGCPFGTIGNEVTENDEQVGLQDQQPNEVSWPSAPPCRNPIRRSRLCSKRLLPADDRIVIRPMFGHKAAFVSGHMFTGTFGKYIFVRAGERQ